jgi:hypothetical protein
MKKVLSILLLAITLASCTKNARVKSFGGEGTLNLPKGQQYKLSLTYDYESTWVVTTNKDDEELTLSGLYDLCTNFTQICKL